MKRNKKRKEQVCIFTVIFFVGVYRQIEKEN